MKKPVRKKKHKPKSSENVPVTKAMLFEVRAELKADIQALDKKFDSRFSGLESKFSGLESKFDKLISEVHRIGLLVEEQNARNKFVLDGYTSLSDRLEKVEAKI